MHDSAHDSVVGLVSVTECARRLTEAGDRVDRSALSRYCDTHALKREQAGRQTLVDFEAVRAHRASSYTREVMSGGRTVTPAPAPVVPSATVVALDPAKRQKAAQATEAELNLARRLGELVEVAEVDAGAAEAIAMQRAAFGGLLHDEAERIAAEVGLAPERVRQLRAGMKRFARLGQERFATELARTLAGANEPATATYARLMTLAGHAVRLRGRAAPRRAEARA